MAVSLSRPDPTSPSSVADAGFTTVRRGFHPDEVRSFLRAVATELRRLDDDNRTLRRQLADVTERARRPVELDDDTVAKALGEEATRVLQSARDSAAAIKARAEEGAAELMHEASAHANEQRQSADVAAAQRRAEAESEAASIVGLAKSEGRAMVSEARKYRERVLADLERRTTMARQQLEELENARQRLLQVFERSRLVAIDVSNELETLKPPTDVVDLTPVTGPVPIVVPASSRPLPRVAAVKDETVDAMVTSGSTVESDEGSDTAASADVVTDRDDPVADVAVEGAAAGDTADTADEPESVTTAGDEPADDTDDEAGDDTVDEVGDEAGDDSADAAGESRGTATNVVDLFRADARSDDVEADDEDDDPESGEPEIDDAADIDGDDDGDDADDDASAENDADVDGLFARLRRGIVDPESVDPESVDPESDTADAAVDDADNTEPTVDDVDEVVEVDESGPADEHAAAFERRDAALASIAPSIGRHLKRLLVDEQNVALHRLDQKEPVAELADLDIDLDGQAEEFAAAVRSDLLDAAVFGATEHGGVDSPTLRESLAKSGTLDAANRILTDEVSDVLRERVERAVADNPGDNAALAKRFRSLYREIKNSSVDAAVTEMVRAAFGAGMAASVTPGTPQLWVVDPAGSACPDCEDNSLAPAVNAGDEFPTGHRAAPAHQGCTCMVLPADD